MRTTANDLVELYDDTIALLKEKVKDRTISGTELSELRKILDAAAVLAIVRAQTPEGKATGAIQVADLPFPDAEELDTYAFPELQAG